MPFDPTVPKAAIKQPDSPAAGNPAKADPQQTQQFLMDIAQYGQFGKALKRATTMQEVGSKLANIAEIAEQAVVNEADDWFDAHTLKRHMKEIKTYAAEFNKLAAEADTINQRMTALYEDMGRVLERYFDVAEEAADAAEGAASVSSNTPNREAVPMQEDQLLLKNPTEPALPQTPEEGGSSPKTDQLTLRAIKAVHERLKKNNPTMAKRFAKLPPDKMKDLVWKLVR